MAEYLASIFGTEKDKVNCSFYFKIGACRHGDRCSRIHNKPTFSQTVLILNLYCNPQNSAKSADGSHTTVSDEEMQEHYDLFFEEVFVELEDTYGEIEEMNVCDNLGDHLVGNVYIKFKYEEDAKRAVEDLNNRWFNRRPMYAELSPVTDFREACCRQYEMGECTRSGFCNFMHLKPISRELRRELYCRKIKRRHGRRGDKCRQRAKKRRARHSRSNSHHRSHRASHSRSPVDERRKLSPGRHHSRSLSPRRRSRSNHSSPDQHRHSRSPRSASGDRRRSDHHHSLSPGHHRHHRSTSPDRRHHCHGSKLSPTRRRSHSQSPPSRIRASSATPSPSRHHYSRSRSSPLKNGRSPSSSPSARRREDSSRSPATVRGSKYYSSARRDQSPARDHNSRSRSRHRSLSRSLSARSGVSESSRHANSQSPRNSKQYQRKLSNSPCLRPSCSPLNCGRSSRTPFRGRRSLSPVGRGRSSRSRSPLGRRRISRSRSPVGRGHCSRSPLHMRSNMSPLSQPVGKSPNNKSPESSGPSKILKARSPLLKTNRTAPQNRKSPLIHKTPLLSPPRTPLLPTSKTPLLPGNVRQRSPLISKTPLMKSPLIATPPLCSPTGGTLHHLQQFIEHHRKPALLASPPHVVEEFGRKDFSCDEVKEDHKICEQEEALDEARNNTLDEKMASSDFVSQLEAARLYSARSRPNSTGGITTAPALTMTHTNFPFASSHGLLSSPPGSTVHHLSAITNNAMHQFAAGPTITTTPPNFPCTLTASNPFTHLSPLASLSHHLAAAAPGASFSSPLLPGPPPLILGRGGLLMSGFGRGVVGSLLGPGLAIGGLRFGGGGGFGSRRGAHLSGGASLQEQLAKAAAAARMNRPY